MNRTILIFALYITAVTAIVPPVIFQLKKGYRDTSRRYVEYRFLWDMDPRSYDGDPYNVNRAPVNEYIGIDLQRFALQLFGIAALAAGVSLAANPKFPSSRNPV